MRSLGDCNSVSHAHTNKHTHTDRSCLISGLTDWKGEKLVNSGERTYILKQETNRKLSSYNGMFGKDPSRQFALWWRVCCCICKHFFCESTKQKYNPLQKYNPQSLIHFWFFMWCLYWNRNWSFIKLQTLEQYSIFLKAFQSHLYTHKKLIKTS